MEIPRDLKPLRVGARQQRLEEEGEEDDDGAADQVEPEVAQVGGEEEGDDGGLADEGGEVLTRTNRLMSNQADSAVLFTATPINRPAADLLGMVELLGADHFADETLKRLERLDRLRRLGRGGADDDLEPIRAEIRRFLVRRTRSELNRIADAQPDAYRLPTGRAARYPRHRARYYELQSPAEDLSIAALYEHVHGTRAAIGTLLPGVDGNAKSSTGDVVGRLGELAGRPPKWRLKQLPRSAVPDWVHDPVAHGVACRSEARVYEEIGELALELSDARELVKVELLESLAERHRLLLGFDAHVLSLSVFRSHLVERGVPVDLFTGSSGSAGKRRATKLLGLDSACRHMVALCSDALSEGINLQAAGAVVHLDTPTVIRDAEQRAGRVDRMDSPHDEIALWWPRDPPGFAPRRRDLLRERHEIVSDLIGANITLPSDSDADLPIEEVVEASDIQRPEVAEAWFDAFRPVRELVGPAGLLDEAVYAIMRTSQAETISSVSVVQSDRSWAFFAVGGAQRIAPRWVLFDGRSSEPRTDLAEVAWALRRLLSRETPTRDLDEAAGRVLSGFVENLEAEERALLPMRRQRALALAEKVFPFWLEAARRSGDESRFQLLSRVRALLDVGDGQAPRPDLRAVADAWLEVFRPVQRRVLAQRRRRTKLWRLDRLEKPLRKTPIESAAFERAFRKVPLVQPLRQRIVAAIVGVSDPQ
ncbi:MAG: helicase-related protein [Myxococcota bacterium]